MKKFIFFLLAAVMTIPAFAQYTSTRYGSSTSLSSQGIKYVGKTDISHVDTLRFYPNALFTQYVLTLTDTACIYAGVSTGHLGDKLTIIIKNSSGSAHTVFLTTSGGAANPWELGSGGATISPASAKNAILEFTFNGAKWVETSRLVQ